MDEKLIDRIYEAGVVPDLWPAVLDELTVVGNGHFTGLFSLGKGELRWLASKEGVRIGEEYFREGWPQRTDRLDRLLRARHAGFLVDFDVYTRDEMDREPVFTEFHRPRGLGWGTATAIPVPTGDMLVFDVERRFETGPVEPETVRRLDALRPHLARAGLLSARLAFERARAAAMALEHVGLPAAVLAHSMKIMAANPSLEAMIPTVVVDRAGRVALAEPRADALLAAALERLPVSGDTGGVRSVPIPAHQDRPPFIVHLIPIRLGAHDVFSSASGILVVTPVVPKEVPTADVLQGLFDLSPAEARVARSIAEQQTVGAIAEGLGLSPQTIRAQLKSVFAKTGATRQVDLAALLAGAVIPRD